MLSSYEQESMIDSHIHINSSQYQDDWQDVIERAVEAGVEKMIIPNVDFESIATMLNIQETYPQNVFSMIGIHPCSVTKDYKKQLEWVKSEVAKEKYCAIGEIGIDLYWDKTLQNEQEAAFKAQILIAHEYKLCINIHSRESIDLCIEIIKEMELPNLKGIFHCFGGSIEQANRIIELGFLMGIGGVITFKNSKLRDVVKYIDLSHLVLETDGPYLTPHPYRGKRNESVYLELIADEIAKSKEISIQEVKEITTKNALVIYGLV